MAVLSEAARPKARDSSHEVTWSIRGRDGPANTPVGYAEMLADAPAGTKVTNAGDSLRTIGLLGAALALDVGFFALTGNSPVHEKMKNSAFRVVLRTGHCETLRVQWQCAYIR